MQKSEISRYKYFSLNQNLQVCRHDGLMQDTMPIEEERNIHENSFLYQYQNIHMSCEVENSALFNVFQKLI